jgi:regulator of cell morphogenesis and NO signaling
MSALETEKTVGEWVVERPARARVFERLGVDYCCGGKLPLRQACEKKRLDYAVVLAELEGAEEAPEQGVDWAGASLGALCDHIEQSHHAYLKAELPRLDFLTTKVAARHGDRVPALREVRAVFAKLKSEMDAHMKEEEEVVFRRFRQLEAGDGSVEADHPKVGNSIEVMIHEHDGAGDALARIRALTDDFTCPPDACNTFRAMYDALHQLERDMHQHVHKENNILFPKAIGLEQRRSAQRV